MLTDAIVAAPPCCIRIVNDKFCTRPAHPMYTSTLPSRPTTSLFTPAERAFATGVSSVAYCNPFLLDRINNERAALGPDFVAADCDWNRHANSNGQHANIA